MGTRVSSILLVVCVVLAGQSAGLCEVVCALTGAHHGAMAGGHGDHADHHDVAAASPAAHGEMTGHVAGMRVPEGHDAAHCPLCAAASGCCMTGNTQPTQVTLAAGIVPGPTSLIVERIAAGAAPIIDAALESRVEPPESQPPRA
ncbi:MAG: hypothetical protein PVJ49_02040 [Acidobacteriota bacterium]|jgi:hypothetical protein